MEWNEGERDGGTRIGEAGQVRSVPSVNSVLVDRRAIRSVANC